MTVTQAIAEAMKSVGPIAKNRANKQQGYNFRGIDDVYNTINPVVSAIGLVAIPEEVDVTYAERESKHGGVLVLARARVHWKVYGPEGDFVAAMTCGEGMDSGDKATNKAMSAAHKYLWIQMLNIPTAGAVDSEDESPEPKPKKDTGEDEARKLVTTLIEKAASEGMYNAEQARSLTEMVSKVSGIDNLRFNYSKLKQKYDDWKAAPQENELEIF